MPATITYDRMTAGPATLTDKPLARNKPGPDRAAERHRRLLGRRELAREHLLVADGRMLLQAGRSVSSAPA